MQQGKLVAQSPSTLCYLEVAKKPPLSMEFSRQEYWSGQPFPSPGDIPHPGVETGSPALQADSLPLEPPGKPKCLIIKLQNAVRETKPDLSKRRNRQIHNHTWSFKRPVGTSQDLFDCCTTFGMGRQRVGSHVKW